MTYTFRTQTALRCITLLSVAAAVSGCAGRLASEGIPTQENIFAVTSSLELIKFNAGQPHRVLERKPVLGLGAGERLVGIDYRISRGVLFALSAQGQLYTLDTANGVLKAVGNAPSVLTLDGTAFGFDFNPAADRIRVVSNTGQSFRMHPETGAAVDADAGTPGVQADAMLVYAQGDANEGQPPEVVAAAYTYNKQDDKITTNFAIDRRLGVLVMQGSKEGSTPVVSPNTGQLRTVGSLGLGRLTDAAFDIADVTGAAFAAVRTTAEAPTRLVRIDLGSGRAQLVGQVGDGAPIVGMAIAP
jgi:Domain of unknown function (DUF4394)